MTTPLRILLVEDNPDDELIIRRELRKGGLAPETLRVQSRAEFLAALDRGGWDLIISDYNLPGFGGMEALALLQQRGSGVPFILVSGTVGEEVAVGSIKAGADDYLLKQNLTRLVPAVNRVLLDCRNRRDRAASERALRESRERLELIFNTVSDFLVFHTRGVDGRWAYAGANRAFTDVFARSGVALAPDRLFGRAVEEVEEHDLRLDPETRVWLRDLRTEAVRTGQRIRAERALVFPEGSFVGEVTYIPIPDADGECRHLLLDGRNVTDLRRAEESERQVRERMLQAHKLESLGTLAGGIAHDFNNMLTGILGFAGLAQSAEDLAAAHGYCDHVVRAANRARELVGRILTFARHQPAARESVSLAAVVEEGVPLLRASFPKVIEIDVRLSRSGVEVLADHGQLHQVLLNLGTNAVQAMPAGGRLTITVEPVELTHPVPTDLKPLVPGAHVRLAVTDTGTGMTAETMRRLFEPFFTTKPAGQGTGLGLPVVHGIVSGHGGVVRVSSAIGSGSTFEVYLPARAAARRPAPPADAVPRGSGERVLCLDDDPTLVELLTRQLTDLGYQPIPFTDPVAAVAAFAAAPGAFAAVLTDNRMPIWTGVEVVRRATALRPGLPAILMSGVIALGEREYMASLARGACLVKPYTADQLAQALQQLLAALV